MNNNQKLEKLQSIKADLMLAPDYPNLDSMPRKEPFDDAAWKEASIKDKEHRAAIRDNLANVNAAIAFVEQQINLEYCLSL